MKTHRQHILFVHQSDNMLTSSCVSAPQLTQSVCFYKEESSLDSITQVVFYKTHTHTHAHSVPGHQTTYGNNHLFQMFSSPSRNLFAVRRFLETGAALGETFCKFLTSLNPNRKRGGKWMLLLKSCFSKQNSICLH